jgi:hypothetical protein
MVLTVLYNASRPQGLGIRHYVTGDMSIEEAEKILANYPDGYFDYLRGRVMKMRLGQPGTIIEADFRLYDRDNGEGAGEAACKGLEV